MELFSTILGLLNPLKWIMKGYRYSKRPKLQLYFDSNETYRKTPIKNRELSIGFFCHLMVKNNGKTITKNCRGRLIEVCVSDSGGKYIRHSGFVNPVVLKWANEMDFKPKDVEPDIPKRLDLCYADESIPQTLIFFTQKLPNGIQTDFPPGNYRVKVRIDADNANNVDNTFFIEYNGMWDNIIVSN